MINLEVFLAEGENVFIAWLEMFNVTPARIELVAAIFLALNCQEESLVFLEAI